MEVVRHGKYKSAVEPFLENEMSNENKYQISSLLNDIWSTLREEISASRGLFPETLDEVDADENNEDKTQFLKLVKDITSKGFVRSNYKKKLVDLSDIKINLKGKK